MADHDAKSKGKNDATLGDVVKSIGELASVTVKPHKKKAKTAASARPAAGKAKKKLTKKQLLKRKKLRNRVIRRIVLCVFTVIAIAVGGVAAVVGTVLKGPSDMARIKLVNSLLETSALKFVPRLFLSQEEVDAIVASNKTIAPEEPTDTSLVVINRAGDGQIQPDGGAAEYKDIELVDVVGATYRGYMLIVRDPSRVSVDVCHNPFGDAYGKYLNVIADEAGAVAAINAGGFEDDGGQGHGGIPIGIVYSGGEMLWKKTDSYYDTLIGFDRDDKLILATGINAEKAKELNLRDAVTFGPALVVNGEASVITGSSGVNPRTAIGQRADGAVLMLVIDGRQTNTLGATMADLIDIMLDFGAVNAANLDGGSSSKLYYNGEFINDGVAVTGSRRLCTAFIVK